MGYSPWDCQESDPTEQLTHTYTCIFNLQKWYCVIDHIQFLKTFPTSTKYLRWTHTALCTPMPTLLSPMTPRVPPSFTCPPHRPPPNDSDTQPVCSPRPPQILASIPCVPSSLLPGFKEGAGQAVPRGLHPGPRREFSTNGESHQTGALFFCQ